MMEKYKIIFILSFKCLYRDFYFLVSVLLIISLSTISFFAIKFGGSELSEKNQLFLLMSGMYAMYSIASDWFYFTKYSTIKNSNMNIFKLSKFEIYIAEIIFNSSLFFSFAYLVFLVICLIFTGYFSTGILLLSGGIVFTITYKILGNSTFRNLSKHFGS